MPVSGEDRGLGRMLAYVAARLPCDWQLAWAPVVAPSTLRLRVVAGEVTVAVDVDDGRGFEFLQDGDDHERDLTDVGQRYVEQWAVEVTAAVGRERIQRVVRSMPAHELCYVLAEIVRRRWVAPTNVEELIRAARLARVAPAGGAH